MKRPFIPAQVCANRTGTTNDEKVNSLLNKFRIPTISQILCGLFLLTACWIPCAVGQVQSTITCAPGDWDVLSIMVMDPGLAANYHMEGITNELPSAYIYTHWDQNENKIYYVKNPQGNPWDVNLYDDKYIYQWVTELQSWNGNNHWNDPASCKKFNNSSQDSKADFSMRWAPRCATPGASNGSFWNSPPPGQPNNTNYYTYVDKEIQSNSQNLGSAWLYLEKTATLHIWDHRANPAKYFSITTLPLVYTYSCSVSGNPNSCKSREIFDYGLDTTANPVDNIKHSYGWVKWRYYVNTTGGDPNVTANWVLNNSSTTDHLMPGQVNLNFQCF